VNPPIGNILFFCAGEMEAFFSPFGTISWLLDLRSVGDHVWFFWLVLSVF